MKQQTTFRFLISSLLVFMVGLPSSPIQAQEDELSSIVRFRGEELYYTIEFFGTEMARGALIMGDYTQQEGQRLLPVAGLALTEGVAAMIYPMYDEGHTLIDPHSGFATTTIKDLQERGLHRRYEVDFLPEEFRGRIIRQRDGAESRYNRLLPSNTHDAFSWIYAIREQDQSPGTTAVYWVYDGWILSRVTVTVLPDHEIILAGEEFINCRRFALTRDVMETTRSIPFIIETAALPPVWWANESRGEQIGVLWISADDRRLPVMVEFQNSLITAIARLQRYNPPVAGY